MPRYTWHGSDVFNDNANERVIEPGETVELSERIAAPHPEFVEASDNETEADSAESDEDESDDEPEYAAMDYAELRQLASDADTDAIDGRSSKEEIVAYFTE